MSETANNLKLERLLELYSVINERTLELEKRVGTQDKLIKELESTIQSLSRENKRYKIELAKLDEKLRYTRERLSTVDSNVRVLASKR